MELFHLLDTVLYNVAGAIQSAQSERIPLWNFIDLRDAIEIAMYNHTMEGGEPLDDIIESICYEN